MLKTGVVIGYAKLCQIAKVCQYTYRVAMETHMTFIPWTDSMMDWVNIPVRCQDLMLNPYMHDNSGQGGAIVGHKMALISIDWLW